MSLPENPQAPDESPDFRLNVETLMATLPDIVEDTADATKDAAAELLRAEPNQEVQKLLTDLESQIDGATYHGALMSRLIELSKEHSHALSILSGNEESHGEVLIEEGSPPGSVYLLVSGSIGISKEYADKSPISTGGGATTEACQIVSAPQIIGEMSHILGTTTASVDIIPPAELIEIPSHVFTEFMNDKVVTKELEKLITERLLSQGKKSIDIADVRTQSYGHALRSSASGTDVPNDAHAIGSGAFGKVFSIQETAMVPPLKSAAARTIFRGRYRQLPIVRQESASVVKVMHPKAGTPQEAIKSVAAGLEKEKEIQARINTIILQRLTKDEYKALKSCLVITENHLDIKATAKRLHAMLLSFRYPVRLSLLETVMRRFEYRRLSTGPHKAKFIDVCKAIVAACGTIVPIPGTFSAPFMKVEDFVEGVGAEEILTRAAYLSEAEQFALALGAVQEVEGINYADVIHRDLKFENMRLEPNGIPRVIDLGLAHPFPLGSVHDNKNFSEMIGVSSGTLTTIAPEQVKGIAHAKTDVFAMGCMLYSLYSTKHEYPLTTYCRAMKIASALSGKKVDDQQLRIHTVLQLSAGNVSYQTLVSESSMPSDPPRTLIRSMLSNDPDARPTMREVRKALVEWKDVKSDDGRAFLERGYENLSQRIQQWKLSESLLASPERHDGTLPYEHVPESRKQILLQHMKKGKPVSLQGQTYLVEGATSQGVILFHTKTKQTQVTDYSSFFECIS